LRAYHTKQHAWFQKSAFTLIELLVVMGIILLLMALISQGLQSAKASSKRLQCLSNIRSLGVASIVYADSAHGNFPTSTPLTQEKCFGLLYDPLSFNDMTVFVCKSKSSSESDPTVSSILPGQYEINGNISYCFVKKQDENNASTNVMQTMSDPATNILLIEEFTGEKAGAGYFDATKDNHEEFGGSCFRINGKAQFIGNNEAPFPPNQNKKSLPYSINKNMTTMN